MTSDVREPARYGEGDLTYNDYLKVPELLQLQQLRSDPAHHDEMLFIVIHQSYELWFNLILHEFEKARDLLEAQHPLQARHFLQRAVAILRLMVDQIHILETMTSADFLQFRDRLKPASGFQSVQFREVEFLLGLKDRRYLSSFSGRPAEEAALQRRFKAPSLRDAFYHLLRLSGFDIPDDIACDTLEQDKQARAHLLDTLKDIYEDPIEQMALYVLSETLVDLDMQLALWRYHHALVVERIIGHKTGTGGSSGVTYLHNTLHRRAFPYLWQVRTLLEK